MNQNKKLTKLYSNCMNCANSQKECPGIWKNFKEGIVPRGFYFQKIPIKLLVVAKNPGHLLKKEREYYVNKNRIKLLENHFKFHKDYYSNFDDFKERSNTFHKNLFRYISSFLDLPKKEIYSQIAHTNLVKCSTKNETEKLNKKSMMACFKKYLLEEIKILKPKVILALGKEVYNFLKKYQYEFNLPIVYIKHPSYFYKKSEEKNILSKIKKEIEGYLKQT